MTLVHCVETRIMLWESDNHTRRFGSTSRHQRKVTEMPVIRTPRRSFSGGFVLRQNAGNVEVGAARVVPFVRFHYR